MSGRHLPPLVVPYMQPGVGPVYQQLKSLAGHTPPAPCIYIMHLSVRLVCNSWDPLRLWFWVWV